MNKPGYRAQSENLLFLQATICYAQPCKTSLSIFFALCAFAIYLLHLYYGHF